MSGFSLLFQVINFVVLVLLLRKFLFKPVNAMIARRSKEVGAISEERARGAKELAEGRASILRERVALDRERDSLLAAARLDAEKVRDELIVSGRKDAQAIVVTARAEMERERDTAARILSEEALKLGADIAKQMVAHLPTIAITEELLARLCAHLDSLSPERKRQLLDERAGADVIVATAPELDEDARSRWADRISLGLDHVALRFVRDDTLLAGAEIRFPYTTLSFTLRDGLETLEKELGRDADSR